MENNVSFSQEQFQPQMQAVRYPFFVRLVMSAGLAKTQRQAEYVLLIVVAVAIVAAIAIFMTTNTTGKATTQADRAKIEATTPMPQ